MTPRTVNRLSQKAAYKKPVGQGVSLSDRFFICLYRNEREPPKRGVLAGAEKESQMCSSI